MKSKNLSHNVESRWFSVSTVQSQVRTCFGIKKIRLLPRKLANTKSQYKIPKFLGKPVRQGDKETHAAGSTAYFDTKVPAPV